MIVIPPWLWAVAAVAAALAAAGELDAQRDAAPPYRLDLAGEWRYLPHNGPGSFAGAEVDDSAWPTMQVPSSWFLLGSRDYPRHADRGVQAAGPGDIWPVDPARGLDWSGTVWFRRTVEWNGGGARPVVIDFDMVDYHAEVFVNGALAGSHEGYFQRWSLDVSRLVRRGTNTLAVRVSAPELPFDMSYRWPISWPKQQDQVKGIFLYHDTRPGATSARGQERSTGGILRGVALRESPGVEIEELRVLTLEASERSARLAVEVTVRNWTEWSGPVAIRGAILPGNFAGSERHPVELSFRVGPGITRATREVRVERPRLWWSWDYGRPHLYRLEAALSRGGGDAVLHRAAASFGIRTITRDSAWVWRLNGRRIYPRGTNYISTQWLSQADRAWYERDVELMLGANLNTVRVHAHLERPEFYAVADSAGLMVWQDFPLQWGYTDSPAFHAEALRQAGDMLRRFGSHPSIIAWCMHNESPHAMTWMRKRDPEQNRALDDSLVALARRMDPSRVHHRDSGTGDGHPYFGWYSGAVADYATERTDPFITEYGAQALPNLETLRTMFPGDTLWPSGGAGWEEWRFRDFQPEQTWGAGVERGRTVEEFVQGSQLYQAQLLRYATELFRRRKWAAERPTTGIYQFMFVENWPSITWAVVDYHRRTKPGYEALRSSMQPLLASIDYRIDDRDHPLSVWVVNDLHRAFPAARVRWRVTGAAGQLEGEGERTVDVAADVAFRAVDLAPLPTVTRGGSVLEAWIDAGGQVLGRTTLSARDFRGRE